MAKKQMREAPFHYSSEKSTLKPACDTSDCPRGRLRRTRQTLILGAWCGTAALENCLPFLLRLIASVPSNQQLCSRLITHREAHWRPLEDGHKDLNTTVQNKPQTGDTRPSAVARSAIRTFPCIQTVQHHEAKTKRESQLHTVISVTPASCWAALAGEGKVHTVC